MYYNLKDIYFKIHYSVAKNGYRLYNSTQHLKINMNNSLTYKQKVIFIKLASSIEQL